MNYMADKTRKGELYPGPDDDMMPTFAGEQERPGFLAGCSYGKVGTNEWEPQHACMPQLHLAFDEDVDSSNYAWVPLARRVDIDRVYRVIKDSNWFQEVEATGDSNQVFKKIPWTHMSPYRVDEQ